jgi:hypothetical protein
MAAHGTHSPCAALHKSGSYRGVICHAFAIARPVSFERAVTEIEHRFASISLLESSAGSIRPRRLISGTLHHNSR